MRREIVLVLSIPTLLGKKMEHKLHGLTLYTLTILSLVLTAARTVQGLGGSWMITYDEDAPTIVVPDDFGGIQHAINNASNGDIILVRSNVYRENIIVNKSVSLLGEDQSNTTITGGPSDIVTIVASNAVVSSFTIENSGAFNSAIKVEGNGNLVSSNVIQGCFVGVRLGDKSCNAMGNVVRDNYITANRYGIFLVHANSNVIAGNIISNSIWNGVEIDWGGENIVFGNTVSKSVAYGLEIPPQAPSYDNLFYHNNFLNNTWGCTSSGYVNRWDNGYPSGGNYWSDYHGPDRLSGPSQDDAGYDGMIDTPYAVDQYVRDRYPLKGLFHSYGADKGNRAYTVNIISNSSVYNFTYEYLSPGIRFQVDGSEGAIGFCRTCIPHGLMSEPYNVTIDGGSPIFVDYNLYENATHRWIYFTYYHSTRQVLIVPEFSNQILVGLLILVFIGSTKVLFHRKTGPC